MSGKFRIQAVIERVNHVPADAIVNTWHFDSDQTFDEDADDTLDRLKQFYTDIFGGSIIGSLASGKVDYKVYDMADPTPRVPRITSTQTGLNVAGSSLPGECSVVLSFQAAKVAGVAQARRRGRIFLGPISANAVELTNGDMQVKAAHRDVIAAAAADLAHGPDAGDARLAVYSPTIDAGGTLDDAFSDVVDGWVDNAVDIQRRRGAKATTRTTWTPS